jgi:hypothetical protein
MSMNRARIVGKRPRDRSSFRILLSFSLSTILIAGSLLFGANQATATGILPPNSPPANIPENLTPTCNGVDDTSAACMYSLLHNIDYARSLEGVGPMILPTDYDQLTIPQQFLAVFNLERTARGLPAEYGLNIYMDQQALQGAVAGTDPPITSEGGGFLDSGGGIAIAGTANPLLADYLYMYDDGVGQNADCTNSNDPGCWGHRTIILNSTCQTACTPVMGADFSGQNSAGVFGGFEGGMPPSSSMAYLNSAITYPDSAAPDILSLRPTLGTPGTTVTIQGVYLTGAGAVYFGGSSCVALPSVVNDGSITVAVPSCASGIAQVQVGVLSDTSNGLTFEVPIPDAGVAPSVNPPFVGMAPTLKGDGYWTVKADGSVQAFGAAVPYGDLANQELNAPIVAITATPDGGGYWLLGADGGVFTFGDAGFFGSTGNLKLNKPIVGMASTPDGRGYWFVASDGGVFTYGDAMFYGSTGNLKLNKPVVGMAVDSKTGGYWLVASDGGIFSFNAPFHGSTGNLKLNEPIVGMEAATDGSGYRFVASDGGVFDFAEAFAGSLGGQSIPAPIVGMAAFQTSGYWLVGESGIVTSFGGAANYGSS